MSALRRSYRWLRFFFIIALMMELVLSPAFTPKVYALPTTIPVTVTTVTDALDGKCDLVEALKAVVYANLGMSPVYHECTASTGENIITFTGAAAGGTIALTMDLPTIWGDTTILGPVTIRTAPSLTETHVFVLAPNARLTLTGVTVTGVHTSGAGPVILDDKNATVNIIASAILNNTADNDAGAIYSNGTVNIVDSTITGNRALGVVPGAGRGGAIMMTGYGVLTLMQTNLAGNIAANGGGAIFLANRESKISDSAFSGNITNPITPTETGGGGAIAVNPNAVLTLQRVAFNGNLSPNGKGGALYNAIQSTVWITDSSFNANVAGTLTSAQLGGAIYNMATMMVARSAFLANSSLKGDGGAIVVDRGSVITVSNSTFAGNNAPSGYGGALLITNSLQTTPTSTVTLLNVTLSTNAANGSGHGGGIFSGPGQTVRLGNTIIDGSVGDNCSGPILSLGHNLDSGTTCQFDENAGRGDNNDGNADLQAPGFNGGPMSSLLTQKLGLDSEAVDAGDAAICSAAPVSNEDQRASARPKDGNGDFTETCDMGAFENAERKPGYGSTPVQPGPIHVGNTTFGVAVTTVFSAFNTGDFVLVLANPIITGNNAADFGVDTSFPLTIQPNSSEKGIQVHCTPTGSTAGQRTATLTFNTTDTSHPMVSYNLTCNASAVPVPGYESEPAAPGPIEFPETTVGTQSGRVIVMRESGTAALTISSPQLSGSHAADFVVNTTFPVQIADGGAPKNLNISCVPGGPGLRSATLTLSTTDPNKPTVGYYLTCNAVLDPGPYMAYIGSVVDSSTRWGLNAAFGVAVSPDGKNVYVSGNQSGSVTAYTRTVVNNGHLYYVGVYTAPLGYSDAVRHITVSPDGKNVYAAGSTSGAVVTYDRDQTTGALTPVHGNARTDLAGADGVLVSPDNRFVYATGSDANSVVVFSRDVEADQLTWVQTITSATHLKSARDMALSPDSAYLYVAGFVSGTLSVYSRNAVTGRLTWVQTRSQGDCIDYVFCFGGLDGMSGATDVVVSPDGNHVYVTGAVSDAVVAFSRDALTGKLHHLETYKDGVSGGTGLDSVYGLAISPDGNYILAAGFLDKAVTIFKRDQATGYLTYKTMLQRNPLSGTGGVPPFDGAVNVAFSADGDNAYVTGFVDDSITVLKRANPQPQLDSLVPSSARVGGRSFTMEVNGAGFTEESVIYWNGTALATTYVNSTKLEASVAAGWIDIAGTFPVQVETPYPGGGTSNSLNFEVTTASQNPVPAIDHLVPAGAMAGSGAFTLDVYGSGFVSGTSEVRWNGSAYPVTYVGSDHLQAAIPASAVAQPGQAGILVYNTSPGGGASNSASFDIAAPGENPIPTVTGLQPAWVFSRGAGSAQFTLIVKGTNFVDGAIVQWNGANRPTVFVDSSTLRVTITGADSAYPGSNGVSVVNPGPGGGDSNVEQFTVRELFEVILPVVIKGK